MTPASVIELAAERSQSRHYVLPPNAVQVPQYAGYRSVHWVPGTAIIVCIVESSLVSAITRAVTDARREALNLCNTPNVSRSAGWATFRNRFFRLRI